MATRSETGKRKQALVKWLRDAVHSGHLRPGEMAPTARELAERFHLSLRVVSLEIQKLVAEGLLHTVARRGTFVGSPTHAGEDIYLLAIGYAPEAHWNLLRIGFEERIAQLGGATMVLPLAEAVERRHRGELPPLAGVFDHSEGAPEGQGWGIDRSLPRVCFHLWNEDALHTDVLAFDDQGGGWQAAQTLIGQGHQRVAFLAMHPQPNPARYFLWSEAREIGWRSGLASAGLPVEGLAFHPSRLPGREPEGQIAGAHATARKLLAVPGITAVVAANDCAAIGLCRALEDSGLPGRRWPAIIGFDGRPAAAEFVLTSLRLPWEELGRTAADFLHERKTGSYRGQPRLRQVPMRLIHRVGVGAVAR